jgi:hypothetical protein
MRRREPKYRHIRQHGFLLREALRHCHTKSLDFTVSYTAGGPFKPDFGLSGDVHTSELRTRPSATNAHILSVTGIFRPSHSSSSMHDQGQSLETHIGSFDRFAAQGGRLA